MIKRIFLLFFSFKVFSQKKADFVFPILITNETKITSGFGYRIHPTTKQYTFHSAIDISAKSFSEVFSMASGRIKKIDFDEKLGIYVIIAHMDGKESWYGHLFGICVEQGQQIIIGEQIGWVGKTGRATGFHLHFGIRENGKWENPMKYLIK